MKGDHSMLRSRGISVPVNAILLTVAIIAITSAVATGAMAYVSAAGGELREASSSPVLLLHESIETVCLSNAGTSTTIILKNDRGPITSSPTNNTTTVRFPCSLPAAAPGYALPDPAEIVSSVKVGGALSLNGVNSYVEVGNVLNFGANDSFTVALRELTFDSAKGQRGVIKGGLDSNPGDGMGYEAGWIYGSRIRAQLQDTTQQLVLTDTAVASSNVWYSSALVVDRKNSVAKLYVDNIEKASVNISTLGDLSSIAPLRIGAYHSSYFQFYGLIDDVFIFSRALNGTEVSYLYQYRVPMNSSGLVGWWRFDEGVPGTATDSSGMGNNGTDYRSARALFGPSEITYNVKMNQFTIPAGVCRVTVSKSTDGSLELEAIAG